MSQRSLRRTSGPLSQAAGKADVGSVPQAEMNGLMQDLYRGYNEETLRRLEGDRSSAEQKLLDTFGKDTLFGRWKPSTIDEVLFELDRKHPGILKLRDEAIDKTMTTGREHAFFTKGDLPSGAPRKMKIESGDTGSMPESFTNRVKRGLLPTQSGFGLEMHTHPRGSALESSGDFNVNTDLMRRVPFFSLVDSAGPQGRSASLTLNDNNLIPTNRREETRGRILETMRANDRDVMDMIYLEPEYRKMVMRGDKIGERERYGIIGGILSPTATSRALARNNMGLHMFEDYGGVPMWSGERWINTGDRTPVPRTIPGSVPQALRNIDRFIVDELGYAAGGEVEADDAALQRMMRELQDENALMRDQEIADQPEDAGIVIDPNTAPESVMAKIYASLGMEGYQRGGKVRPGGQLSRQEAKKVAENLERASTERDIRNVPLPSDISEVFDAIDYSIPGTKHTWSSAAQDTINKNIEHGFFSAPDPVALSVASDPRNVPVFASNVLSGGPHEIDLIKPRPNAGTMLQHPSAPHVDPYHTPGPHGFGVTMHTHPNTAAIPSNPDFDMSSFIGRDIGDHANLHGIEGTFPDTSSRSLIFTRPDLAKSAHRFGLKQQINWDLANDPDFFRRAQLADPAFETRANQLVLANNLSPILTERLLDRVGRGKVWTQFDPNTTLWTVDGKPFTTPGATDEILKSFDDVVRQRWGYADGGEVDEGGLARFRRGSLVRVQSPLRAYHGSPHKFDEFDMGKIGTGEGAQVYGHGLYFAENPDVAKSYKRSFEEMAEPQFTPTVMRISLPSGATERQAQFIENALKSYGGDEAAAIRALDDSLYARPDASEDWLRDIRYSIDALKNKQFKIDWSGGDLIEPKAYMYDVNLHVPKEKFITEDGWWTEQPQEARQVFDHYLKDAIWRDSSRLEMPIRTPTGLDEYFELAKKLSDNPNSNWATKPGRIKATNVLREAGVPGIRYLDAGSRAAGTGTRNIVMFDDAPIEIVNRYAEGGAVSDDMLTYGMRPQAMSDGWRASSPAMEYSWPTPQQQADTAIASGMSSFTPGSAGDGVSTGLGGPPGRSTPGTGYDMPGRIGSVVGSVLGSGIVGGALGNVIGTAQANQDLMSMGVTNQINPATMAAYGAVPFGSALGLPTPQTMFNDIVVAQLTPDQYTDLIGRISGPQPEPTATNGIPGVDINVAPGMGPPGSPGADPVADGGGAAP